MSFARTYPSPEQRSADRSARIAAQRPPPTLHRATLGPATTKAAPPAREKVPGKVRQAIRDSARGEECTVRVACWGDVIWSHGRWGGSGRGKGVKALDLCGAYACLGCDGVFDGNRPRPAGMTQEQVDLAWMHGHMRSLVRLAQKGLL